MSVLTKATWHHIPEDGIQHNTVFAKKTSSVALLVNYMAKKKPGRNEIVQNDWCIQNLTVGVGEEEG
jgi:hypothetical protein